MAIDMLDEWFNLHPTLTDAQRQFLEAAVAFYQDLCRDDQAEPDWVAKISDAHRRVGEIERRLDRLEQAERAYERGALPRSSIEQLVAHAPQVPLHRRHLAEDHGRLAVFLREKGREAEADDHFRRARELD